MRGTIWLLEIQLEKSQIALADVFDLFDPFLSCVKSTSHMIAALSRQHERYGSIPKSYPQRYPLSVEFCLHPTIHNYNSSGRSGRVRIQCILRFLSESINRPT
jgi:hypothetical protein